MTTTDDKDEAALRAAADAAFSAIDLDELEAEVDGLLADPTMKEILDGATAPYRGVLVPAALEAARREIAVWFIADPMAAQALEEARAAVKSRVVPARTPEALRLAAARAVDRAGNKAGKP